MNYFDNFKNSPIRSHCSLPLSITSLLQEIGRACLRFECITIWPHLNLLLEGQMSSVAFYTVGRRQRCRCWWWCRRRRRRRWCCSRKMILTQILVQVNPKELHLARKKKIAFYLIFRASTLRSCGQQPCLLLR